jgi:cellulose synthase/poly-beta-1,6-N-acetylglucosamine synthase-like glycosyltransferase
MDVLVEVLAGETTVVGWALVGYFLLANTSFLVLTVLASVDFGAHARRAAFRGYDDTFSTAMTPPVSVLVPAHNERVGIVEAVRAMTSLRYPEYEVVVIDDGSDDGTLDVLQEAFDLVEVPRVVPADVPTRGPVESVHVSRRGAHNLVVVRKRNGGKSDALNTGINVARNPLVCMVDADSILDPDALLHVSKPFAEDPERVVATGGVIRAANGCTVEAGRVVEVRMPRRWLPRIQVVEYLRAFLVGRSGWSRAGGLIIISGAFGLFRRDLLLEVGGLSHDCIGEDAELVVRLHRLLADRGRRGRIVFVAEPVAWTEVPDTRSVLGHQRRRWARGIAEILLRHRRMFLNPRYGVIGMLALPWFLLFEVLSGAVELVGLTYLAVVAGLEVLQAVGIGEQYAVDSSTAVLLLAVSLGYSFLLTVVALAMEEFSFHRYRRRRDLVVALLAAATENLGYRYMTAWWRVAGTVQALRASPPEWGAMTRVGFGAEAAGPERSGR